jgi:hypothetical protein
LFEASPIKITVLQQDEFSPKLVAQDPKEDSPEGWNGKAQKIDSKAGKEADGGIGTRKNKRPKMSAEARL